MNLDNKYNGNDKGQKIAGALYLVTAHISDMDPLRIRIREEAVALLETPGDEAAGIFDRLSGFLHAASYANLISEHNKNIILAELKYHLDPLGEDALLTELLQPPAFSPLPSKKMYAPQQMSYMSTRPSSTPLVSQKETIFKNKEDRQTKILSFINDRKSATIKDITALFPGLSEKTVQRELGAMVHAGKITKRGDKRWSIYLSV